MNRCKEGAGTICCGLTWRPSAAAYPTDTLLTKVSLAVNQAVIELQRNQPQKAIAALEPASRYDLGTGPNGANYSSMFFRAAAYLKLGDHLGGARANVLQKDSVHTRSAYQNFFAAWKDADPDIPILREAKAEYAKLK